MTWFTRVWVGGGTVLAVLAQVVSIGGSWGTATRALNGAVQLVVAVVLWRTARHAYPGLRPWWGALAGTWTALAVSLLAAPLHLLPSTWTPWMVHGVLMVIGPVLALQARHAVRVVAQVEDDLHAAMRECDE